MSVVQPVEVCDPQGKSSLPEALDCAVLTGDPRDCSRPAARSNLAMAVLIAAPGYLDSAGSHYRRALVSPGHTRNMKRAISVPNGT